MNTNKIPGKGPGQVTGKDSDPLRGMAARVRAKYPATKKETTMEKLDKQAAVRQMSAYLAYLAHRVPMGDTQTKVAAFDRIAALTRSLNETGDLGVALDRTYPTKSASYRTKLALKLIKGLAQKRALAIKLALGTSTAPLGVSQHPSVGLGAPSKGIATSTSTTVPVKTAGHRKSTQDPFVG